MRELIRESRQEKYVMEYLDKLGIYEDVLDRKEMYYRDKHKSLCFIYTFGQQKLLCDEALEYQLRALFDPQNLAKIIVKWFKIKFNEDVSEFFYEDIRWDDENQ